MTPIDVLSKLLISHPIHSTYIKRSIKFGVEYRNDIPNTNNGPYFVTLITPIVFWLYYMITLAALIQIALFHKEGSRKDVYSGPC
jgi:hypothetical protein